MTAGYVGLGSMGLPMALNLRKAGFDLGVVSRSRSPVEQALAAGAHEASSYAGLAAASDVVCTCLPMPADVERVYLEADVEQLHDLITRHSRWTGSPAPTASSSRRS